MLKFMKVALFLCVLTCAVIFITPGETHAAGYELTWSGFVIYLSKAEALKMAENMEVNANWGAAIGVVGIWLPDSIYKKVASTCAVVSQLKYRAAAKKLRKCSSRGATVTVPLIGLGALVDFKVQSR